jgi:hypothetical protein
MSAGSRLIVRSDNQATYSFSPSLHGPMDRNEDVENFHTSDDTVDRLVRDLQKFVATSTKGSVASVK